MSVPTELVSHEHYIWFITAMAFGTSAAWLVVDIVRLRRALREGSTARERNQGNDRDERSARHDRIFGSVIGLVVAIIGLTGVLRFYL